MKWYELKYDLAEYIYPKLGNYKRAFNQEGIAIPVWLESKPKEDYSDEEIAKLRNEWSSELDKMILAFRSVLAYKDQHQGIEYDESIIEKGLQSFSQYFIHLWD